MPNTRRVVIFIACALSILTFFFIFYLLEPASGDEAEDWPMFRLDYHHTGYKEGLAPDTNETMWTFDTGTNNRWVVSSPMIVDGYVYIGCENGKLYKLDLSNGTEVWNYTADAAGGWAHFWSSPFVDLENDMVFCHADGVHAVNLTTGERIWRFDSAVREFSSPVVHDGVVFVGSYDNCIYALPQVDPNGDEEITSDEIIWIYYSGEYQNGNRVEDTGGAVSTTLAIVDGMVLGAEQTQLDSGSSYCDYNAFCLPEVDPDGSGEIEHDEIIWKYEIGEHLPVIDTGVPGEGGDCFSSPSVNVDMGQVYIGSRDMHVYCLALEPQGDLLDNDGDGFFDNEGELIWRSPVDNEVYSSPSYHDGLVYIGSGMYSTSASPGSVYCFQEDNGNEVWSYPNQDGFLSSPLVADDKVFIGSNDHTLYAFNGSSGEVLWSYEAEESGENVFGSSPSLYEDMIVIGNCNGRVYSFSTPRINYAPEVELASPFDGMKYQSGTPVVLEWDGSDPNPGDHLTYDVYLSYNSDEVEDMESSARISMDQEEEWYDITEPEAGRTYHWRIVVRDDEFETPSDVREFKTNALPVVELDQPESGEIVSTADVTLHWHGWDEDDEDYDYELFFDSTDDPTTSLAKNLTADEYEVTDLDDGETYYWKIRIEDEMEYTESDVWSFTVDLRTPSVNTPPTIILETPEDGVVFDTTEVMLGWTGEDEDGDDLTYTVYLDTDSEPGTMVAEEIEDVYWNVVDLEDGETYYWKVEVSDGMDEAESEVRSFSIDLDFVYNTPPGIELTFPINGITFSDNALTLMWKGNDDDKDPLTYDVYLGIDPNSTILVSQDQTNSNYPCFGLLKNQTYYWYVVVKDGTTEVSSETRNFHIEGQETDDEDDKTWYEELTDEPIYLGGIAAAIVLVVVLLAVFTMRRRGWDEQDWEYDDEDEWD